MVNETTLSSVPPALIKLARKLMDLSQADLAKLAGVSLRTLVDVENEEREPMRATMARLRMSLEDRGASFFGDGERMGVRVVPARVASGDTAPAVGAPPPSGKPASGR